MVVSKVVCIVYIKDQANARHESLVDYEMFDKGKELSWSVT